MKYLSLLPLAGAASAAVIERRQSGDMAAAMSNLPEFKAAKTMVGTPTLTRDGIKQLTIWWGPLDLKNTKEASKGPKIPNQMDPNSNSYMGMAKAFPGNVLVLRSETKTRFEDGKEAKVSDGIYNHHTAFTAIEKQAPKPFVCSNGKEAKETIPSSSILTAVAEEGGLSMYSSKDGSFNAGYYVPPNPKILYSGEIINYNSDTKRVYIVTELEYVEGRPNGSMDSGFVVLSVQHCDPGTTPMLRPPPGQKRYNYESKAFNVTQDGYILMRRGHLHDGGENIVMTVNGKEICNSEAIYGQKTKDVDGKDWMAMSDMTQCNDPFRVYKGDQFTINAFYDLDKHPARKHAHGGTGMMGGDIDAEEMGVMSFVFAGIDTAQGT